MCRQPAYTQNRTCHQHHGGLISLAVRGIKTLVGGSNVQNNTQMYPRDKLGYVEQPNAVPTANMIHTMPVMNDRYGNHSDRQMRKANKRCRKANRKIDKNMAKFERYNAKIANYHGDEGYVAAPAFHPGSNWLQPDAQDAAHVTRARSVEELPNELPPAYGSIVEQPSRVPKPATVSPKKEE